MYRHYFDNITACLSLCLTPEPERGLVEAEGLFLTGRLMPDQPKLAYAPQFGCNDYRLIVS